jgi:methyl-accepting chemotaxis protein
VSVQTVAATAEELSASIDEIGRQVTRPAAIAGEAVSQAEATNSTVQGLTAEAQRIGEVVKLIEGIAQQIVAMQAAALTREAKGFLARVRAG